MFFFLLVNHVSVHVSPGHSIFVGDPTPPGVRPELPTADRWLQGAPLTCHGFIYYVPCQGMPRNKAGLLYERNMEQILWNLTSWLVFIVYRIIIK